MIKLDPDHVSFFLHGITATAACVMYIRYLAIYETAGTRAQASFGHAGALAGAMAWNM
jgi:hypothetical protein